MPSSPSKLPVSSTLEIPEVSQTPRHVAIVMDGNGRWAASRRLPRMAGHERGVNSLREVVRACAERGVQALTVFAFSSENWRRPEEEVSFLMNLFLVALQREVKALHEAGVQLRVIGDLSAFNAKLREAVAKAEEQTRDNRGLVLSVAVNYGGRWDLLSAMRRMLDEHPDKAALGARIGEEDLAPYLSLADLPEPDLFIRTGGETRISNFLLWQIAYTECYFTPCLWPDFDAQALDEAFESYRRRERRFGRAPTQLSESPTERSC
ncbi:MAG: di-trans,poly-cis-decaprenylcistransferase [Betaproteobacteria bacterium]|nr:di-trans,poly-cis-decaprenylcistransferase [Betaproteobacteria bacterium]NCA15536.1 di-trans,poly-cis-decaprenylcistransferase [Betaproteobacteria bacterium]